MAAPFPSWGRDGRHRLRLDVRSLSCSWLATRALLRPVDAPRGAHGAICGFGHTGYDATLTACRSHRIGRRGARLIRGICVFSFIVTGLTGCIKIGGGGDTSTVRLVQSSDSASGPPTPFVLVCPRGALARRTRSYRRYAVRWSPGSFVPSPRVTIRWWGSYARHTLAAARLDAAATQALIDLVPADERWSEIPGSIASQDSERPSTLAPLPGQPSERIVLGAEDS